MKSGAQVLVVVLTLCGTLGCSSGSPEASPAPPPPAPAPTPPSAPSEGSPDYPEPPGLESLSSMEELERAPTFTPYTVRPDIKNRGWVARMLEQEYPPQLREMGIGGKASIWCLLDETGVLKKTQLLESSGNPELDRAALRVVSFMEFTPAYNKDRPVAVWIAFPVTFSVKK